MKQQCRCGKQVEQLTSYFHIQTGMRITICAQCAAEQGLLDTTKYQSVEYSKLKPEQQKTSEPAK